MAPSYHICCCCVGRLECKRYSKWKWNENRAIANKGATNVRNIRNGQGQFIKLLSLREWQNDTCRRIRFRRNECEAFNRILFEYFTLHTEYLMKNGRMSQIYPKAIRIQYEACARLNDCNLHIVNDFPFGLILKLMRQSNHITRVLSWNLQISAKASSSKIVVNTAPTALSLFILFSCEFPGWHWISMLALEFLEYTDRMRAGQIENWTSFMLYPEWTDLLSYCYYLRWSNLKSRNSLSVWPIATKHSRTFSKRNILSLTLNPIKWVS